MIKKLKKVQEYLEGDYKAEFMGRRSGEFYTGSMTIIEDGCAGTMYFDKGVVTGIAEGEPADGIQFGLSMPGRLWNEMPNFKRSFRMMSITYCLDPELKVFGDAIWQRTYMHTFGYVALLYSYVRDGITPFSDWPERDPDPAFNPGPYHVRGFYRCVNGVKVYYETNDAPDDRATIICLHTAGRESRQYHELFELFAGKYRCYALDMPGHGKSWPLPGNELIRTPEDFGKWIHDMTVELGVENPIYIGCSYAGGIVYHMAQEYGARAIMCMQGCDNTYLPDGNIRTAMFNHPASNPACGQIETSDTLMGRKTPQSRIDFIKWGVVGESGFIKQADYQVTNAFNASDKMDRITCPVRIMQGLDDVAYTYAKAKGSLDRLVNCKNKKLIPVEGSGHFICVENPELVARELDEMILQMEAEGI